MFMLFFISLPLQSASVGGAAHLINFQGTATVVSLIMARSVQIHVRL